MIDLKRNWPMPWQNLNKTSYTKETFKELDSPEAFYRLSLNKQNELIEWCKKLNKIKSYNKHHSSYGLKHMFEHNHFYVYNGQFKGAMLLAGFNVKNIRDLNWYFNISEKSIRNIK